MFNPTSAKPQLSWPLEKAGSARQSHHCQFRGSPALLLVTLVPDNLWSDSWERAAGGASSEAGKVPVHLSTTGCQGDGSSDLC